MEKKIDFESTKIKKIDDKQFSYVMKKTTTLEQEEVTSVKNLKEGIERINNSISATLEQKQKSMQDFDATVTALEKQRAFLQTKIDEALSDGIIEES